MSVPPAPGAPIHWLFVRGLSREARHWLPFPEQFEQDVPGARVHLLDLPGAGTEWRRTAPLSVGSCMRDVRRRWLDLRDAHPGRWAILGISLGGMVVLRWMGQFPGDFECAVVINTSAADLSPPWRRMRLGVMPGIVRAMRTSDPVTREREILRATTRLFSAHEATARRWAGYHHEQPITRVNVLRQLAAAARFRSPPRIDVPLLVLAAAHDPLARADCGRRIADRYRARFQLHPMAGHDLPLDDPGWVTERVAEFAAG
jgi:pimeloyl-[acyl-carrier protein] methyl ester esterase